MNRFFAIAIAVFLFGFLTSAHGQDPVKPPESEATAQDKVKLPESETTAVFKMEFSGGFSGPLPKTPREPFLQIFADGRVVAPPNLPDGEPNEFQMTPEQLQTFLKQVVNDNKFYELDTDKIKEDVAAAGPAAVIADAPTLKISMDLPRGTHSVSAYTPRSTANQLTKVKSIKHVANIEDLGRKLTLVAKVGGYEKVEDALSKVNEQLKEKGLDLMTMNELYTCKEKDGILTINFNRKYYNENGRWRDWINAKFTIDGDEENVEIKTNKDIDKAKVKPEKQADKPDKS